jgi:hypothetical protein
MINKRGQLKRTARYMIDFLIKKHPEEDEAIGGAWPYRAGNIDSPVAQFG